MGFCGFFVDVRSQKAGEGAYFAAKKGSLKHYKCIFQSHDEIRSSPMKRSLSLMLLIRISGVCVYMCFLCAVMLTACMCVGSSHRAIWRDVLRVRASLDQ